IQCHHYMAVTGKKSWYIAVVILGQGFKYAEIPRDDALIDDLICIEEKFWEGNVIPGIMPQPDGSRACDEVLEEYFKISRRNSEIPLIGFDEKLKRRMELEELIKKMERDQKQIDQEIKLYMNDNEAAVSDHYRVTWVNVVSSRVDTKRLKAEMPDIYQDYLNVGASRRFTVKAA
ncbi:MAG: endonuclease, partial [Clostridium sp.]|nr:endonuclease [Clostridium sp.]